MFDGLARSADDITDRLQSVSTRTAGLLQRLPGMELAVRSQELFPPPGEEHPTAAPLRDRQTNIPTVLSKRTNCAPVLDTYSLQCALPPPLWKIEVVFAGIMPEDELSQACVLAYSHPGTLLHALRSHLLGPLSFPDLSPASL